MNKRIICGILLALTILKATGVFAKSSLSDKYSIQDYETFVFELVSEDQQDHHWISIKQSIANLQSNGEGESESFNLSLEDLKAHVEASLKAKEELLAVSGLLGFGREVTIRMLAYEVPVVGEMILGAELLHVGSHFKEYVNLQELRRVLSMVERSLEKSPVVVAVISRAAFHHVAAYLDGFDQGS